MTYYTIIVSANDQISAIQTAITSGAFLESKYDVGNEVILTFGHNA